MYINQIELLKADWRAFLFPSSYRLVPNIYEVYEFDLAFLESRLLSEEEVIQNGAFFTHIGDRPTRHFLICTGQPLHLPDHSSNRLKEFFERNQFRTGYGTHGLFPYRGKFHPQMIKALMNIMGLKPGQTVLDPMMGSGTVCVEASLMGINSIGMDISPFCEFMARTKLVALTMDLTRVQRAQKDKKEVFEYFNKHAGLPSKGDRDTVDTYNLLLLAYLDSRGYAERTQGKDPC